MRITFTLLFLSLMLLGVSACGVKPGSLEPPEGVEDNQFPRNYPTY